MNEFNNRITAQRQVLRLVNQHKWEEELLGLSSRAIERWSAVNRLDLKSPLVALVKTASLKLFFLATKSQEQVSEQYRATSSEIAVIVKAIEVELG
jgi:hypothetical protein